MRRLSVSAASLALLLVGCAEAAHPVTEPDPGRIDDGHGATYMRHAWTEAREIPDGDRRGVLVGPIPTGEDGSDIGPLVLRLDIRHPATVDLDIRLAYDADGDGTPEVRAPVEFHHSRSSAREEELYACPTSLDGTYFFRDDPGGPSAVFAAFRAVHRGHAFYLAIADTLAEDTGSVLGWAVYTKEPGPLASH